MSVSWTISSCDVSWSSCHQKETPDGKTEAQRVLTGSEPKQPHEEAFPPFLQLGPTPHQAPVLPLHVPPGREPPREGFVSNSPECPQPPACSGPQERVSHVLGRYLDGLPYCVFQLPVLYDKPYSNDFTIAPDLVGQESGLGSGGRVCSTWR